MVRQQEFSEKILARERADVPFFTEIYERHHFGRSIGPGGALSFSADKPVCIDVIGRA